MRPRPTLARAALAVIVLALASPGTASAGALHFDRVLPGHFRSSQCAVGSLPLARCFLVDIGGLVPGLGRAAVHEEVLQSGDMDLDLCEPQVRYGTITTARGSVRYEGRGIDCPASREQNGGYRAVEFRWDVVDGTGAYAGVSGSGSGTVRPDEDEVFIHLHGDLDVPGLAFDTAKPVFGPMPRTQSANIARGVADYAVPGATDAVDGAVPVTCSPSRPYRVRRKRTTIRCEAVDSSGNVAVTSFVVVVRRAPG